MVESAKAPPAVLAAIAPAPHAAQFRRGTNRADARAREARRTPYRAGATPVGGATRTETRRRRIQWRPIA